MKSAIGGRAGRSAPFLCLKLSSPRKQEEQSMPDLPAIPNISDLEIRAENRAHRQNDRRWRTAFENSGIGIIMADFAGRFFVANTAFLDMLGYTESELYRLTFLDITYEEDRNRNLELVRELVEGKRQHFQIEKRYRRKDGTLVWARTNVALVPGIDGADPCWFAIVEDITERKRAEEESLALRNELTAELTAMTRLHEFSTRLLSINDFRTLLEEVLDATIALQHADLGNIQMYNAETQALEIIAQRGFQRDFLEHFRNVDDESSACGRAMKLRQRVIIEDVETDPRYTPHRRIAASAGFRAIQSTPLFSRGGKFLGMLSTHFRQPHRPALRDLRFTDLYAAHAAEIIEQRRLEAARRQVEDQYRTAVEEKGRIIKWFGSVVDLHECKEAQQTLQMMQVELARVSRVTTMGELAASIAHEINQPLTAVANNANGCLRLLADRNLEPGVLRRVLEEIVTDSTRASAVVARIRAFIRKAPVQRNKLDLNEVIQEVLALTSGEMCANRVLLERRLTEPLPPVMGDRVQLQQVLLNLIMNSIEALTPVTDRPRLLAVQSRVDESNNVLVAVSDSGAGLGLGTNSIFTPFFTTKANGMGMGLPISRSLIEGHGGQLWAAPNSPHGTVFSLTLPVAPGNLS
jgi:PAS domain S-box-containing protein